MLKLLQDALLVDNSLLGHHCISFLHLHRVLSSVQLLKTASRGQSCKKKNIYTKLNKLVNHFIHWSEIHPAPDTYCHTYKYNCLWPRAIIDWNSILSNYLLIESSSKFKATISDILSFWDFIQFYWKSFSYLFLCSNSCIFVFNV